MSWFSGLSLAVELDNLISEATLELIPNGGVEISIAYDITDRIRLKKYPPQQCMRLLKKRLTMVYSNPNRLKATLQLADVCVKNLGYHFLVEIASKEFMDYLAEFILKTHYNVLKLEIRHNPAKLEAGTLILRLIKEWLIAFEGQMQLGYVEKVYRQLVADGFPFPDVDNSQINNKFVDLEVAPDWVDLDECMICYNKFLMVNRKHHCRACGGVFCQQHLSHQIPLVLLGLTEPVRVCDTCYAKNDRGGRRGSEPRARSMRSGPSAPSGGSGAADDEDEQLRQAIAASLADQGPQSAAAPPPNPRPDPTPAPAAAPAAGDDEDAEMKAALAASLAEYEQEKQRKQDFSAPLEPPVALEPLEPPLDFYNIDIPSFGAGGPGGQSQFSPYGPGQPSGPPGGPPGGQLGQPTGQYGGHPGQPQPDQPAYAHYGYLQPLARPQAPAMQPKPKPPPLDLSQQDEEKINLFITMMTTIKSDDKKRANIMYDLNLNELHAKVTTLKPKVNRLLRNSIERYDQFNELNNKILTAVRMYDEFLEAKLNLVYGQHQILYPGQALGQNTGYQDYGYGRPQETGPPQGMGQHGTGHGPSHVTGPQGHSTGPQGHSTGSHAPHGSMPGYPPSQDYSYLVPPAPAPPAAAPRQEEDRSYIPAQLTGGRLASQPKQQQQHLGYPQDYPYDPNQGSNPNQPSQGPPQARPELSPYPTSNDTRDPQLPQVRNTRGLILEPLYYPQHERLPDDDDATNLTPGGPDLAHLPVQLTTEMLQNATERFPALDDDDADLAAINNLGPVPQGQLSLMAAFPAVPEEATGGLGNEFSSMNKFPELLANNTAGSRHTAGSRYEPESLIEL